LACHNDRQQGAALNQGGDAGTGLDQPLEAVEHDDEPAATPLCDDPFEGGQLGLTAAAEHLGQDLQHQFRLGQAGKVKGVHRHLMVSTGTCFSDRQQPAVGPGSAPHSGPVADCWGTRKTTRGDRR
jgi:hypothetical protein